ncbi:MAG: LPS export ABC transporter ATP-binding protein [Pseudomonadota bacterium]|nr:LPS export ABC transporter ATP-binding protein [Pseudomonadota bacterium]
MKTLELKNIKKSFKKKEILHGIDLQIRSSEVFGLLGPNGAGKTTLFSLISGLEMTTSGKIFLDEYDITFKDISFRASKGIIYLPQEPSVFRKLSVADNIKAALQTKFKNIQIEDKYTSIMKEFDLFSLEKQISENLSGGQRRKLEIARAFALEPKFILLDEPFAGIDPLTINEIKNIISKLRAKNVGVVISDHNAQATMDICDNISVINNGEIIASGNPSSIKENNTVQQIYLGENLT